MRQQKHSVKLVKVLILRSKRHGRIKAVFGFTMGEIIFVAESFTGLGSETLDFPRYRQRGDLNLAEYTTTLKLGCKVSIRPKKALFVQFRGGNLQGGLSMAQLRRGDWRRCERQWQQGAGWSGEGATSAQRLSSGCEVLESGGSEGLLDAFLEESVGGKFRNRKHQRKANRILKSRNQIYLERCTPDRLNTSI